MTDHITVPEEYERIVERVLGADVFCVLLKSASDVAPTVAVLEEYGASDFSLVPVDIAQVPVLPEDGPGVRLVDVLGCSDDVWNALNALIGDVRVVDTLDEALAADAGPWRLATRAGHTVWPSGRVRVGPNLDDDTGVLARRRALVDLKDRMAALDTEVGAAEALSVEATEALAAAQQDALEIEQRIATLGGEEASLREDAGRIEQSVTDADTEAAGIELRLRQIEEKTSKGSPQQRGLAERIEQGIARIEELEDAAIARREERDMRFREESEVASRLSACQVEIAAVSEREIHLKRRFASLTSETSELQHTVAQSSITTESLEILILRIQPLHDVYAELLERAEHWAERLRDRARFEQADSESLRQTIHGGQDGVRAAQAAVEAASGSMGDVRVEKAALEVQVTAAVKRIVEDLGVPIERALEVPQMKDRAEAADRAHKLRKRIANLGPVNPIAVEEFQGLRDRRDFMQSQLDDLLSSRKALQKVITAIDRKVRDRFLETFELVNNHFQDVFAVLFPGGHASLTMTEPDNPEETGVEVVAQPRGKRLQKMTLLSGGEKSLTALALLFAVYRTRPCPFYILDEVEAALDDTNLRRFIAFVDSLRTHTQFVVVTHQRRTMEMADVLYGVSMQADGVSKVVSQKLERVVSRGKRIVTEPWYRRIGDGLAKTRGELRGHLNVLLRRGPDLDAAFWEELEDALLQADMGIAATTEMVERLRDLAAREALPDAACGDRSSCRGGRRRGHGVRRRPVRHPGSDHPRGGRQRYRKDHERGEACEGPGRVGEAGRHRLGRHVPGRRHRAAAHLGRARERSGGREAARVGPGGGRVRHHRGRARAARRHDPHRYRWPPAHLGGPDGRAREGQACRRA